ncbi:serine/threonine-protein kinase [Actinomadura rupiterrae]|uniref:serine/threonine-protein kinase n=1 Tax=Actinomadura rupiterrae TaxID=559627 RepID=UPI0020A3DDA3|nr:serine/threonine-protein kinase [Actinomadura rupiterrae]MCP2335597.1 serine/threonine protein kinase [Actinomadura rupiterrae]
MEALRSGDPRRLGGYDLLGRLGVGGQGVVYLGRSAPGRRVAVKLLHPGLTEDPAVRARFVAEAAAARRVARFCTAEILEVNVAGDQPYVVTEYVAGPSLRHLVTARGPLAGAELERLAIGMATALAAIHTAGIVHRDFKPANVLLGPDGPRVVDFGLARALDVTPTQTGGRPVGTPAFMSPEQLNGDTADLAMDVFAYGATLVLAGLLSAPMVLGHGVQAPRAAMPRLIAPTTSERVVKPHAVASAAREHSPDGAGDPPSVFGTATSPGKASARGKPSTGRHPSSSASPASSSPSGSSPQAGMLWTERGGVQLAGNWSSHSFRIWAEGGPVHWTSSTGPYLSAPAAGDLAAEERSEITVDERPAAPATGCDTVTLTGERNSRTLTICWG